MKIIISGGTFSHIRNHMALCAPAFGNTGKQLKQLLPESILTLTKMADSNSNLITNQDVQDYIDEILLDPKLKCIIMNAALCDYDGEIDGVESGSHAERLETKAGPQIINITPANKVIGSIKSKRPDVIVVGFKTTTNASIETQIEKAKKQGVDICIANDTVTRQNIVVSGEDNFICNSRAEALKLLADGIS